MERYVPFEVGEFYHIYNRGVDKRKIFFSAGDWKHFQRLLYICNDNGSRIRVERVQEKELKNISRKETLVDIVAYAMMDNHFHLVLKEKTEGGITKFMRKLGTAHAMYMNTKYERSGPLMCRPFRSRHIDSDEYFRWLMSYVHLNPIDTFEPKWKEYGIRDSVGTNEFLQGYKYSSYIDYFVTERNESLILNKRALPIDIDDLDNLESILKEFVTFEIPKFAQNDTIRVS